MASPWLNFLLFGYALALVASFCGCILPGLHWVARLPKPLLVAIWLCHTLFVVYRWVQNQHPPFASLYDTLIFFAWALVLAFLILKRREDPGHGVTHGVMGISLFTLGLAFFMDASVKPLLPALQSHWISIHVASCFVGYGAFGVSFITSILYLFVGRRDQSAGLLNRLDRMTVRAIEFGFPFLTIGIIVGAIWANEAWGTYWSWDPKETWALITWIIYAVFLHGRRVHQWEGCKTAILSILGFLSVLFSFVGVNFFLSDLHSYL